MRKFLFAVVAAYLAFATQPAAAQVEAKKESQSTTEIASAKKKEEKSDAKSSAPVNPQESRWFELKRAEISFRVRYIDGYPSSNGHSTHLQHRELFEGRLKFDQEAKYTLNLRASSGFYFTRSFAEAGVGHPWNNETGWNMFLRHMYFSAKPVKGLELQYGSMPFAKGVLEENDTWDEDGYVSGQRISVRRPDKLFFDDATVTFGYVGDLFKPNFFRRAQRLGEVNYRQFLVTKNVGKRTAITAEYESKNGTLAADKKTPVNVQTVHVGTKINTKGIGFADRMWFDFYRRFTPEADFGYNIHGEKGFMKDKLIFGMGFTRIDKSFQNLFDIQDWAVMRKKSLATGPAIGGSPSAEKITRGNHLFFHASYKLSPEVTVFAYGNADFRPTFSHGSANQMNAGVTFDLLKTMQKVGWFK